MIHIALVRKPPCELNIFFVLTQQNLGRRFNASKMHFSKMHLKVSEIDTI